MTLSITHTTPADGTFSTTGAAAWDATHTVAGVGTMAEQDANAVAITGGAISGTTITVADNVFALQDNLDPTKQAQFQLSSLTAGVTFSYVLPLGNGSASNLVDQQSTQTITGIKTFAAANGTFGSNTGAGTIGFASGATTTGLTKTVNIGTAGLSGSTTAITVGAVVGTSTTTMNGQTDIGGTTTSVNFARIVGAATGAAPTISAQGSDANISLLLNSKGTGVVALGGTTAANSAAQFVPTTSSVNFLTFTGGTTNVLGGLIAVGGTDTNANLVLRSKGTFNITFQTSAGAALADIAPSTTGFGVNALRITASGTGAAPELSSAGSDANINLKLTPKGTGTLQFGTHTAGIIAQAGYITITDAGGTSRRLLVG